MKAAFCANVADQLTAIDMLVESFTADGVTNEYRKSLSAKLNSIADDCMQQQKTLREQGCLANQ